MDQARTCEPCKHRNKDSKAKKYCSTCQEVQCMDCAEVHRSGKATRSHKIVDIEDNLLSSKFNETLETVKTCKQHKNKLVEFLCGDHGEVMCGLCLLTNQSHRECRHIVDISCCANLTDDQFTDKLINDLNISILRTKYAESKLKESYDSSKQGVEIVLERLNTVRDSFIAVFENQKREILKNAERVFSKHTGRCKTLLENAGKVIVSAEEAEKFFREVITTENDSTLFHCITLVLDQLEELRDHTTQISKDSTVVNIKLDMSPLMRAMQEKSQIVNCKLEETRLEITSEPLSLTNKQEFFEHITGCKKLMENNERLKAERKADNASSQILHGTSNSKNKEDNRPDHKSKNDESDISLDVRANHEATKATSVLKRGDELRARLSGRSRLPRSKSVGSLISKSMAATNRLGMKQSTHPNYKVIFNETDAFDVSKLDGQGHWFGGIVCLPDDRLVLSDYLNTMLLVLSSDHQIEETIPVKYGPGAIALLNHQLIAVCMMKVNQILLVQFRGKKTEIKAYLNVKFHPKCVQRIDEERMLVSMKDAEDEWYLDILQHNGKLIQKVKLNGFYDGYKVAVQKIDDGNKDRFRIIQYCDIFENLRCFKLSGEIVFSYAVDRVTCVLTDSKGFIFLVRLTGEVQVLSPNGKLKGHFHKNCMRTAKYSSFSCLMDKLYITKHKQPAVHVLDICRKGGYCD